MATNIEWSEETWNPTVGCSEVSPGCTNCYAAKMAYRIQHMNNKAATDYNGTAKKLPNGKVVWTGQVNMLNDRLLQPAKQKKPTTYFVDSMSDLFHEDIPFAFIDKVFAVMMLCPQHTFQVLTKRTARMLEYVQSRQDMDEIVEVAEDIMLQDPDLFYVLEKYKDDQGTISMPSGKVLPHLSDFGWSSETTYVSWCDEEGNVDYDKDHEFDFDGDFPAKHIWLGTSIENQKAADERGAPLYEIHRLGWVTWVSNEPMIGPVNWETPNYFGFLNWMVTGGESGKDARPMYPDWARGSRDFCAKNKIAFFFKQWGAHIEHSQMVQSAIKFLDKHGNCWMPGPMHPTCVKVGQDYFYKVGKHDAGRLLDGKLHDAYPQIIRNSQIS